MSRVGPDRLAEAIAAVILVALPLGCDRVPAESNPTAPSTHYEDVTASSGLDFIHRNGGTGEKYLPETMGSGGCVLDFDGDGRMDVYLVQSGNLPGAPPSGPPASNRLLRNTSAGWRDVTDAAGAGDSGYGMGATAADFDGDGDTDVYVVNFGPNVLLENLGDGRFRDVTATAGVGDASWGSSATFFDADGDGDLDLYVVNYVEFTVSSHVRCGAVDGPPSYCHPDVYPAARDVFYRNAGDGRFVDATVEAGFASVSGKGLGVVAADLTGDGHVDVFVANDSTANFLFVGDGAGRFSEQGLLAGVSHNEDGETEAGMGVDAGDVDGDGRADVVVTNLDHETNALHLAREHGFDYATRTSGISEASLPWVGFGVDLLDFDRDGDLDLLVVNGHVLDDVARFRDGASHGQPGQLLLNDGGGRFVEVAPAVLGALAEPCVARGALTLDFDDDGALDVLVLANGGPARLLRNRSSGGHWVGFRLEGRGSNRCAVGAEVTVVHGKTRRTALRINASGYQTSHDPRLHFGLGPAVGIDDVEIRWPDGAVQHTGPLTGDRYYSIKQGAAPVPQGG